MKISLLIILTLIGLVMYSQTHITNGIDWDVTNITSNNELNAPNTLLYGPDGYLWITERVVKDHHKFVETAKNKGIEHCNLMIAQTCAKTFYESPL
jgi:hypothetical protein